MSEAKDKAALAASQAKHSANNAGRAVEAAVEEGVHKQARASSKTLIVQSLVSMGVAFTFAAISSKLSVDAARAAVLEAAATHDNVTITTRGRKVG